MHSTVNSIELLQLHLKLNKNTNTLKLLLLYRPPNSINPPPTIHNILYQVHDEQNLLILGDFNINPQSIVFSNILNDLNLTQHIHEPTHNKGNTLDLIITRNNLTNISTQIGPKITDHNIINIYLKYTKSSAKKETITYRNLKNINNENYTNDLYKLIILDYNNTDIATQKIHQHLEYLLEIHAPIKTIKVQQRCLNPWWTPELSNLHRLLRKIEIVWRKDKNICNRNLYNYHKKYYFNEIKLSKSLYYHNIIDTQKYDMKLLYKTFNILLKKKTKSNHNIDSDKFASFFINKIKANYDDIEIHTSNHNRSNYLNGLTTHSITSNPISIISPEYIETIIKSTHFKTCIYIDNITSCQLKKNLNYFCLTYTELINKCIEQSHFPLLIKHTIITPILKNSSLDKTLTKNYRPIYNLSFLSKIIEKIIANHLTNHITNNNLDNPRQTAYKRKNNTETLLLDLTKYISYNIHNNKYVILIQLDLTAAFDTINHMILYKN